MINMTYTSYLYTLGPLHYMMCMSCEYVFKQLDMLIYVKKDQTFYN